MKTTWTCVYCGEKGPTIEGESPPDLVDALKRHHQSCEDHPIAALKAELAAAKVGQKEAEVGCTAVVERCKEVEAKWQALDREFYLCRQQLASLARLEAAEREEVDKWREWYEDDSDLNYSEFEYARNATDAARKEHAT